LQTKQALREGKGTALPILDSGARRGWVVSVNPRPLYQVPNEQEGRYALRQPRTDTKNIASTRVWAPDRLARSKSLYRLRYPGRPNPAGTWKSVSCECCVLSGRGVCDGPITRPEEAYWVWCVELNVILKPQQWRGLGPLGLSSHKKTSNKQQHVALSRKGDTPRCSDTKMSTQNIWHCFLDSFIPKKHCLLGGVATWSSRKVPTFTRTYHLHLQSGKVIHMLHSPAHILFPLNVSFSLVTYSSTQKIEAVSSFEPLAHFYQKTDYKVSYTRRVTVP
jgi:hypothetical protein